MAWALLDDNFPHHPKSVKAGNAAAYLFVCGLCYCRKYHTGGVIPREAVRTLGVTGNERKMIEALLEAGLWQRTDAGFSVHDYDAIYANDAADKAGKDERSRQKREAGRKGGLRSWEVRSKQNDTSALSTTEAETKQPASSFAEAHRDGTGLVLEVLSSSSEKEKGEPRFDEWVRELQQDYPQQRVTSGHLTEKAFIDALSGESDGPRAAWRRMRDNLENQKRGHEWRITPKFIPKLENWLRSGAWKQQHDEYPTDTLVNEKTARTLSSAAAFIKAGER